MSPEIPSSPQSERAEEDHELDVYHASIRQTAKDLREKLQRYSPRLANHERLLQLVEELLTLVPVRDQEFEDEDERGRAVKRGQRRPFADDPAWVGRLPDADPDSL